MRLTSQQKELLIELQNGELYLPVSDKVVSQLSKLDLVSIFCAGENKGACFSEDAVYYLVKPKGKGLWPIWAIEHFPTLGKMEEVNDWHPFIRQYALHRKVLVVMTTRIEGCWKAYCGSVPGINHQEEKMLVLQSGDDVGETLALCMFPEMSGVPYAR